MNRYMNKAAAVLALLAVSLCAGCNGNAAQTTTTAALSLIADDDTSEDEILLDDSEEFDVEYGDWDVEEFGELLVAGRGNVEIVKVHLADIAVNHDEGVGVGQGGEGGRTTKSHGGTGTKVT